METKSWMDKNFKYILGMMITFIWGGDVTYCLYRIAVDPKIDNLSVLIAVLNGVSLLVGQIAGYYWGSSQGSDNHAKTIEKMAGVVSEPAKIPLAPDELHAQWVKENFDAQGNKLTGYIEEVEWTNLKTAK